MSQIESDQSQILPRKIRRPGRPKGSKTRPILPAASNQFDEHDNVWGAKAIAAVTGLGTKERVFHLVKLGQLPGVKKIGAKLVGSRKILRNLVEHIPAE
jgi:hypothetical protein